MAKKWLIIIFISLCIISCSTNNIKKKNINEIATLTWQCDAKKLQELPGLYSDMKMYDDSLILMCEHISRHLIKFNRIQRTYSYIGNWGDSNGEFKSPFSLIVEKDGIILNESNRNEIQKITINGKFIKRFTAPNFSNATQMAVRNDSIIYFLNFGATFNNYVTNNKGEAFFKVPNCIYSLKHPLGDVGSILLSQDTLFMMNPYEWKINKVSLLTKQESSIKLNGIEGIYDWERFYQKTLSKEEEQKIMSEEFIFRPLKLFRVTINNKFYYLVLGGNQSDNKYKYEISSFIFDLNGNLLFKIDTTNELQFITCDKNNLLLGTIDHTNHRFSQFFCYRINEHNDFL